MKEEVDHEQTKPEAEFKLGEEYWNGTLGIYQTPIYQKIGKRYCRVGCLALNLTVYHDFIDGCNMSDVDRPLIQGRIIKSLSSEKNSKAEDL